MVIALANKAKLKVILVLCISFSLRLYSISISLTPSQMLPRSRPIEQDYCHILFRSLWHWICYRLILNGTNTCTLQGFFKHLWKMRFKNKFALTQKIQMSHAICIFMNFLKAKMLLNESNKMSVIYMRKNCLHHVNVYHTGLGLCCPGLRCCRGVHIS